MQVRKCGGGMTLSSMTAPARGVDASGCQQLALLHKYTGRAGSYGCNIGASGH
jgi:hypothetical protein